MQLLHAGLPTDLLLTHWSEWAAVLAASHSKMHTKVHLAFWGGHHRSCGTSVWHF
jgi:hypothetical protein